MSIYYVLANHTRRESIWFSHIDAATQRELAGNPASAAMIAWYLLEHPGDLIAFVADSDGHWPFPTGGRSDLASYRECTDEVVQALLDAAILEDNGRETYSPDDPELYSRKLRNIWQDNLRT